MTIFRNYYKITSKASSITSSTINDLYTTNGSFDKTLSNTSLNCSVVHFFNFIIIQVVVFMNGDVAKYEICLILERHIARNTLYMNIICIRIRIISLFGVYSNGLLTLSIWAIWEFVTTAQKAELDKHKGFNELFHVITTEKKSSKLNNDPIPSVL